VTPIPRSLVTLWSAAATALLAVPLDAVAEPAQFGMDASTGCSVSGTPGDDVITGTSADDVICGLEGNDLLDGESGNDVLLGGWGDDQMSGSEGVDVASYETSVEGIAADLASGTASGEGADALVGVESLIGSAGDDVLRGSAAENVLSGLGGTDLLFGGGGADTLLGGDGEDFLTGSGGTFFDGGNENDTCRPDPGPAAVVSCLRTSPQDENDTHGFLDVKHIESSLETDEPVWRVITISRWSAFRMWDRGFVLVYLDTFGGPLHDYYALIRSVGTRLRATLYRNGHKLGSIRVWRPNNRSVSIQVALNRLLVAADRGFYRWRVVTLTDRCRNTCFDRIPDEGAMVEPLQRAG
jgi:hypothetical protein